MNHPRMNSQLNNKRKLNIDLKTNVKSEFNEYDLSVRDYRAKFQRTKACRFGRNCVTKNCNYAHSLHEFDPVRCMFGEGCTGICTRIHPGESREQVWERSVRQEARDMRGYLEDRAESYYHTYSCSRSRSPLSSPKTRKRKLDDESISNSNKQTSDDYDKSISNGSDEKSIQQNIQNVPLYPPSQVNSLSSQTDSLLPKVKRNKLQEDQIGMDFISLDQSSTKMKTSRANETGQQVNLTVNVTNSQPSPQNDSFINLLQTSLNNKRFNITINGSNILKTIAILGSNSISIIGITET